MSRLLQHPEADDELQAAIHWYAIRGGRKALRFDKKVNGVMQEIRTHPDRDPYYDSEFREAAVPKFPYSVICRAAVG